MDLPKTGEAIQIQANRFEFAIHSEINRMQIFWLLRKYWDMNEVFV